MATKERPAGEVTPRPAAGRADRGRLELREVGDGVLKARAASVSAASVQTAPFLIAMVISKGSAHLTPPHLITVVIAKGGAHLERVQLLVGKQPRPVQPLQPRRQRHQLRHDPEDI